MTLVDFLLARIEDDEAHWGDPRLADPGRIERRMLAECEAKRRIVERHYTTGDDAMDSGLCGEDDFRAPCPTLRLLALPYADHADYDESWRP